MIRKCMLLLVIFAAYSTLFARTSQCRTFQHLVVFGDSLSDNGIDDGHGFLRYSNGKVWPEYLSEAMAAKSVEVRAWSGANDLHDPDTKISSEQVAANVMTALKQLVAKGVRHVMVWNLITSVIPLDADGAVTRIAGQFENTKTPWKGTKFYPEKGEWFWFDHWHYMTESHMHLAREVFDAL